MTEGINLATKYAKKMDLVFTHGSYTDRFVNKDYDFDGVESIHVYTPTTVDLTDYKRDQTGDRFGGNNELKDTVATYQLKNDKAFKIAIDRGNYIQGAFAKEAGKVMKAQINERVIPAIDKDRFKVVDDAAKTAKQQIECKLADGNHYESVLDARAYLDECQAPTDDRVMFVSAAFYKAIKKEITEYLRSPNYNDKLVPKGFVGELDGLKVILVPTSFLPENTHAIIWQKSAVLGANQIKTARIKTDSELVDGAILMGRYIFGTFVLKAKEKAVATIVESKAED